MKNLNITITGYKSVIVIALITALTGCKQFLEIDPPKDKFEPKQVFDNDETATSAVLGIYSQMAGNANGFASGENSSVSVLSGLSADEFRSHAVLFGPFAENQIQPNDNKVNNLWSTAYNYIYVANSLIEGLPTAGNVSEATKSQLLGEAKLIRAFCYFYLANIFGDIPLIVKTDYRSNENTPKSASNLIYDQITADLLDAESLLSNNYPSTERVRPNKWVAKALLSRVYLFNQKWNLAIQKATEVIDYKVLYQLVTDLDKVFLKNSTEAIWQLMPIANRNTYEGAYLILTTTPTAVSLRQELIGAFDNPLDNRRNLWIKDITNTTGKYYYPFKYKIKTASNVVLPVTEYSMVIRLAELYLIRAEANAKLDQAGLAMDDINTIRARAGLTVPLVGLTSAQCITEVEKQRRLEFFSEWGHRWLDLKRTGRATVVLPQLKGTTWQNTDVLYPIPETEINRNNKMIQNLGYEK